MNTRIVELLRFIYGRDVGNRTATQLSELLDRSPVPETIRSDEGVLDQSDAFLITYGDQFQEAGRVSLDCLKEFAESHLCGVVSGIHILPFFPYSSDDGFSIIDYREVNPEFGDWSNIDALGQSFKLMADLVLNHCSAKSRWFENFQAGRKPGRDYFITVEEGTDLSMVTRPRALPLLTAFETTSGRRLVWTTFSEDQVDLDYSNPDVLLQFIGILLFYVQHGVRVIRLDAIAYLWKEVGHSCIHHPKTHAVVKLFRQILDEYAPSVILITETNVPQDENLSYFGEDWDEASMIYQFPLPPLVMDAFQRGDASHLSEWASRLPAPRHGATYFNFLASHDGVGITPARGLLSQTEIDGVIEKVKERGGLVSYKASPKGDVPYELNINYLDAVTHAGVSDEQRAAAFLASQAVILVLQGVPGIYVHSLIGSRNYPEGVEDTGMKRSINRQKLVLSKVLDEIDQSSTLRNMVFDGFSRMLKARSAHSAFHPSGPQEVIGSQPELFVVRRTSPESGESLLCVINVGSTSCRCTLPVGESDESLTEYFRLLPASLELTQVEKGASVNLCPYQVAFLILPIACRRT